MYKTQKKFRLNLNELKEQWTHEWVVQKWGTKYVFLQIFWKTFIRYLVINNILK